MFFLVNHEYFYILYLFVSQEQMDGQFTIDPNMGSAKDAFKCYCQFGSEDVKTCVKVHSFIFLVHHNNYK